ncbi:MAG TPA: ABC transporter permease [Reyranella sp.]|nr:ABC transporter permease [Reyranella sp.]
MTTLATGTPTGAPVVGAPRRSRALALLRAVVRHRLAALGLAVISLLLLIAVFAPLIAPYGPDEQDLYAVLAAPSLAHWLGTDNLGRDLLSRLIYGSRVSLFFGLGSTAISALLGAMIGLVAGYRGGLTDAAIMRMTDAFLCFPPLVFILAVTAALGAGLHNLVLSFALFGWTGFARIMRGQVLLVRELPFVEAARAAGLPPWRIMLMHVLPNTLAPMIVAVTITAGLAILTESGISFLGLGVQPPTASWGKDLRVGFTYLETAPLFSIAPGVMITLAVVAFNFLGDGLRDALDPRLKGMGQSRR